MNFFNKMKKLLSDKKGMLDMGGFRGMAVGLVIVGITVAVGLVILATFANNSVISTNTVANQSVADTVSAISLITDNLGLLVTILIFLVILGAVFLYNKLRG